MSTYLDTSKVSTSADSSNSKDRKGGLSCAECRRSKLKCDRTFPCQSCIRRGCSAICPDGILAATKGNKVLMAQAQKLAEKVKSMSTRIQELEIALSQAQTEGGDHPLLRHHRSADEELDYDKNKAAWDSELAVLSDSVGSLSIGSDGQTIYHGETASSEFLKDLLPSDEQDWDSDSRNLGLPPEIVDLMYAFPFGRTECPQGKRLFTPYIPSLARALELVDLYYENGAWMYQPLPRTDFTEFIWDPIYNSMGYDRLDGTHSHRLAVFFFVLGIGAQHDPSLQSSVQAKQFNLLARAAISLDSILQEATYFTVLAVFLLSTFIYTPEKVCHEARWLMTGLCARMAQTIGLQRDCACWNLDPSDIQRRRVLFWDLYTFDSWTSIVNGRPPALTLQHTNCHFPIDSSPSTTSSGEQECGWHMWKIRYSSSCLWMSIQHVFSPRTPSYAALLELDKKIRKFPIPEHLQPPIYSSETARSWSSIPSEAMQQYCVLCVKESNLLYVHRRYFAQAIRESKNPLQHKYGPSVLATYRSACRLISTLKSMFPVHVRLVSRAWFFWSAIFSSCIVLGALVVESPGCTLAADALQQLEQCLPFYDEGSRPCRPPATLTMLQKLLHRARSTYVAFHAGVDTGSGSSASSEPGNLGPDELDVLGGRKSVVNTKSSSTSPPSDYSDPSTSLSDQDSENTSGPRTMPDQTRDMLMDYYDTLGTTGFDTSADYQMGSFEYPTGSSSQAQLQGAAPAITASAPYRAEIMPEGISGQALIDQYLASTALSPISAQGGCQLPNRNLGFPDAPQSSHTFSLQAQAVGHGSQHPLALPPQGYQALEADYPTHTNAFGGFVTGHEGNQDDIWRHFLREFGTGNFPQ